MKVVLATGGSGGHLFPAIAVAEKLQEENHDVYFLGYFPVGKDLLEKRGFAYQEIQACGFSWKRLFSFLYYVIRGICDAGNFINKYRPDIVIGFGGYASVAPVLAARKKRIPVLMHEQNVRPGKANKFLSSRADKIAISFKESQNYLPKEKCVFTGCPIFNTDKSLSQEEARKIFSLKEDLPTILVFAGSQGSEHINRTFIRSLARLNQENPCQVIHLAGKGKLQPLGEEYQRLSVPYFLSEFLEEMSAAYQAADIVVSRSGAVTVSEIIHFNKKAVLIPYPHAGAHQRENARDLEHAGQAIVIEDSQLTEDFLKEMIQELLNSEKTSIPGSKVVAVDAAKNIVKEAKELIA